MFEIVDKYEIDFRVKFGKCNIILANLAILMIIVSIGLVVYFFIIKDSVNIF